MKRILSTLLLTAAMCTSEPSQRTEPDPVEKLPQMPFDTSLLKHYGVNGENVSAVLIDLKTNSVVESHNPDKSLIPASTTKVPSMVAALDLLGAEYRFETKVLTNGRLKKDGILDGDLYLVGGGDPALNYDDLYALASYLSEDLGIQKVSGMLYYDDTYLPVYRQIDEGMDEDASYNPGLSALSLNYNLIALEYTVNPKSKKANMYFVPGLPQFSAKLTAKEKMKGVHFYRTGSDDREDWLVYFDRYKSGREALPVRDPSRYTAEAFAANLRLFGLEVAGVEQKGSPVLYTELAVHKSQPLYVIVQSVFEYSNNFMADIITLTTARKWSGRRRSLEESIRLIEDHFAGQIQNFDREAFRAVNGSGLSAKGKMSAMNIARILQYADRKRYAGRSLASLMPGSGVSWGMKSRLNRSSTAMHVRAKPGAIHYGYGLGGFIHTAKGRKMAFAVVMSNDTLRAKLDKDPERRTTQAQRKIWGWAGSHRNAMDATVARWIKSY